MGIHSMAISQSEHDKLNDFYFPASLNRCQGYLLDIIILPQGVINKTSLNASFTVLLQNDVNYAKTIVAGVNMKLHS